MGRPVAVLLLDDGELDDVQAILDDLGMAYGRVRGGAIARNTPAPTRLLISTPRRIDAVPSAPMAAAMANHSLEWSAARVSCGMTVSSKGLGDSATASTRSRTRSPCPTLTRWAPRLDNARHGCR